MKSRATRAASSPWLLLRIRVGEQLVGHAIVWHLSTRLVGESIRIEQRLGGGIKLLVVFRGRLLRL